MVSALSGKAQSLSPEVLSTAGGTSQVGKINLEWTLGETAISRWATPAGGSITEGFHQPLLIVSKQGSASTIALVSIAPNPVQARLNLIVSKKEPKDLSATLIDVQGRVFKQLNHLILGNTEVDLQEYPAGVYFLSFQYANEIPFQTFKVVKVQ